MGSLSLVLTIYKGSLQKTQELLAILGFMFCFKHLIEIVLISNMSFLSLGAVPYLPPNGLRKSSNFRMGE